MSPKRQGHSITPRNDHTLIVGIVARISGCANQTELSLDDQVDHAKQIVAGLYDGPVEYRIISATGKGERLDRPELEDVRVELRKGELDLLVMEDLGRLVRGGEAVRLFGVAVDHGVRAISPNDHVDTINSTWEEDALSACRDHVAHNAHTSRRLKHKLMNRFQKFGGATSRPIAGYVVPVGAKTHDDWYRDEETNPVIKEGGRLLAQTLNGQATADYFNAVPFRGGTGFPPGPYSRSERWDGTMVLRYFRNRMLSGRPGRGFRHTVKHHETGRRISVRNPDGPCYRNHPQLAHLDPDEQDELISRLADKHANKKRKGSCETDPRWRTPRKRTRWPGQCGSTCWYCGHDEVWGGNGVTKNLMCSAAREWRCWNSFGFDGRLAAKRITAVVEVELDRLAGFDAQFRESVSAAARRGGADLHQRWRKLEQDEQIQVREQESVAKAVRKFGDDPIVAGALAEVRAQEQRLARARRELKKLRGRTLRLPASVEELRALFRTEFEQLATDSFEFGDLLRKLVPEFHVYLVRLCDGGHPLPRVRAVLALDGIVPDAQHVPGLPQLLRREVRLDLFIPPQRERIREEAVRLAATGLGPKEIAHQFAAAGKEKPTATAVQKALALDAKMKSLGRSSPYVLLTEPPTDYPKLRRHLNGKYRFHRRDGYEPPPLPPE